MTQAACKQETTERRQHHDAICLALGAATKGSGWRAIASYSAAIRDINGLFVQAKWRPIGPDYDADVAFQCLVKPMAADPLLWQILDIEGNETKSLSFRMKGVFTCSPVLVNSTENDGRDLAKLGKTFRTFLEECHRRVIAIHDSFADLVASERVVHPEHKSLFETHVLALILENRLKEARLEIQRGMDLSLSVTHSFFSKEVDAHGQWPQRMLSFAEMANLWIEKNRTEGG